MGLEQIVQRRIGQSDARLRRGHQERRSDFKLGELLSAGSAGGPLSSSGSSRSSSAACPCVATLHELNEEALIDILTKPKNALVKQFQKLFEMDGVKLKFTKGRARGRRQGGARPQVSGARGLRAILEHAMLDIMYDIPSRAGIKEVVINEDVITKRDPPLIVYQKEAELA